MPHTLGPPSADLARTKLVLRTAPDAMQACSSFARHGSFFATKSTLLEEPQPDSSTNPDIIRRLSGKNTLTRRNTMGEDRTSSMVTDALTPSVPALYLARLSGSFGTRARQTRGGLHNRSEPLDVCGMQYGCHKDPLEDGRSPRRERARPFCEGSAPSVTLWALTVCISSSRSPVYRFVLRTVGGGVHI